jgi:hypothetical protein
MGANDASSASAHASTSRPSALLLTCAAGDFFSRAV